MILNVYNIRDERQGVYGTPFYTDKLPEQVCSDYENTVKTLQANIERLQEFAPEKAAETMLRASSLKDCVIYTAGSFDTESGEFKKGDVILVCRVSDYFREVSRHA